MKITAEKLEKKILALLFQLEVRERHLTIGNLVEEMLIGRDVLNDILYGRAKLITTESLFSLTQQLYHGAGTFELMKGKKLLYLDNFDSFRDALKSFFRQPKYERRSEKKLKRRIIHGQDANTVPSS